jgi:hypothetical protein
VTIRRAVIVLCGLFVLAALIIMARRTAETSAWIVAEGRAETGGAVLPVGKFPTKVACETEIERRFPGAPKTGHWYLSEGIAYGCFSSNVPELLKESRVPEWDMIHGDPPKDANDVPAEWCPASIATDYGQTPPKEIVTNPAGWCRTGDTIGVPTAGGYTAQ